MPAWGDTTWSATRSPGSRWLSLTLPAVVESEHEEVLSSKPQ